MDEDSQDYSEQRTRSSMEKTYSEGVTLHGKNLEFDNTSIYIENINPQMTEEQLIRMFGEYGPLINAGFLKYRRTEDSRSLSGFVTFLCAKDANEALEELNGKEVMSFKIELFWGDNSDEVPEHPIFLQQVDQNIIKNCMESLKKSRERVDKYLRRRCWFKIQEPSLFRQKDRQSDALKELLQIATTSQPFLAKVGNAEHLDENLREKALKLLSDLQDKLTLASIKNWHITD